jgi:hypothetical protein
VSLQQGVLTMDEQEREIRDRISRRRMIKRLGAATAVAWTAPVLSTLGATPAFAQPQPCPQCVPLGQPRDVHCTQQPRCGAEPTGNPCACVRTTENTCFCHSCIRACTTNPLVTVCTSSSQCPAGWGCALSCCSQADNEFRCLPPCGGGSGFVPNNDPCVFQGAQGAGSGQTSMG